MTIFQETKRVLTVINGTANGDNLVGTKYADFLSGGDGNDIIKGQRGDDILRGGNSDDKLYGGHGDDRISGGDGNDVLFDLRGTNKLKGGAGDDLLIGDEGLDNMIGGKGRDIFVIHAKSDDLDEGITRIQDFEIGIDKLSFDSDDPNLKLSFQDVGQDLHLFIGLEEKIHAAILYDVQKDALLDTHFTIDLDLI